MKEDIGEWNEEGSMRKEEGIVIRESMKEVNEIMEWYVGIVGRKVGVVGGWKGVDIVYEEREGVFKGVKGWREIWEVGKMINVG